MQIEVYEAMVTLGQLEDRVLSQVFRHAIWIFTLHITVVAHVEFFCFSSDIIQPGLGWAPDQDLSRLAIGRKSHPKCQSLGTSRNI